MKNDYRSRALVLTAMGSVVAAAALLAVRISAGPASGPPPGATSAAILVPCWGCPGTDDWPIKFRTNLDLLAPLGTGAENAASWFAQFAKPNGTRYGEAEAAI